MQANGVLYVYECAQQMQHSYATGYYDNGTEQYSQMYNNHPGSVCAPTPYPYPAPARSAAETSGGSSSASPSCNDVNRPPSDIFTASSEVSEQEELLQQQEHAGGSSRGVLPGGKGSPSHQRSGRGAKQQQQQRPFSKTPPVVDQSPPKPRQPYETAFPSLAGGGEGSGAVAAPPARRWTPALATRKLRTDAPTWSPGQAADHFTGLSMQVRDGLGLHGGVPPQPVALVRQPTTSLASACWWGLLGLLS